MKKNNFNITNKYFTIILLTLLIVIISFPGSSPEYDGSYDGSAYWGLNFLFNKDITLFNNLIFPWGPLSFLKVPVVIGNHVIYSIIFLFLSWFTFIYLTLLLGQKVAINRFPFTFIMVLIMAMFFQIDHALITITAVSILHFNLKRTWGWMLLAAIATSIGMYVKASIGIVSLLIIFTQIIYDLIFLKKYRQFLIYTSFILSVLLLPGFIFFYSISGTFSYFLNTLQLSFYYSETQSLFPENNMFLLFSAIALFFLFPVTVKDKNARKAYLILFLAFFFNWKYSISREDLPHYSSIYSFIVLGFGLITIFAEKIKIRQVLIPTIIFSLFYLNMSFFPYFSGRNIEFSKVNRLNECIFNLSTLEEMSLHNSKTNSSEYVLDTSILNEISTHSVDVYPWNLAYISENNLQWKPGRQLLFLAYSSNIDKKTSSDFSITNGPDYLIFHGFTNRYGGTMGSLDNRYILSDEPNTILKILNNYNFVKEIPNHKNPNNGAILFKKRENSRFNEPKLLKTESVKWNTWIKVPQIIDGIERVKTHFSKTFFQKIKSFFYKDQPYFIEYKLLNGKLFRFNFNPATAKEGLWISPFFNDFMTNVIANQVQAIRFTCTNDNVVSPEINLEWNVINFNKSIVINNDSLQKVFYYSSKLFGLQSVLPSPLIVSVNDFDEKDSLWTNNFKTIYNISYIGNYSGVVEKKGYSSTFIIKSSAFTNDSVNKIIIQSSVFSNLVDNAKGCLVISYSNDSLSVNNVYKSVELPHIKKYFIDNWVFSQFTTDISIPINQNGIIKVYVWNTGNVDFYVDDFEVSIYKAQ